MLKKLKAAGIAVGVAVAILVLVYAASWIVTCGLIKLITMCFGWTFKWSVATGIWLLIMVAKKIFSNTTTVNNHHHHHRF